MAVTGHPDSSPNFAKVMVCKGPECWAFLGRSKETDESRKTIDEKLLDANSETRRRDASATKITVFRDK